MVAAARPRRETGGPASAGHVGAVGHRDAGSVHSGRYKGDLALDRDPVEAAADRLTGVRRTAVEQNCREPSAAAGRAAG